MTEYVDKCFILLQLLMDDCYKSLHPTGMIIISNTKVAPRICNTQLYQSVRRVLITRLRSVILLRTQFYIFLLV